MRLKNFNLFLECSIAGYLSVRPLPIRVIFAPKQTILRMLNVVLFGPPGAGKGTQSEILLQRYGLVHLSTGDIFRYNIKNATELGQQAKAFMDKGELVPDSLTISMLESEVVKHTDPQGFIFDGFPRTSAQAEALDRFLNTRNTSITCMLALEVDEEELIKRLLNRATTSGRADDADEAIVRNRIAVYNRETAPVAGYYKACGKYRGVKGVGTVEEITSRLCDELDAFVQ
jgi:adenylate kinase